MKKIYHYTVKAHQKTQLTKFIQSSYKVHTQNSKFIPNYERMNVDELYKGKRGKIEIDDKTLPIKITFTSSYHRSSR